MLGIFVCTYFVKSETFTRGADSEEKPCNGNSNFNKLMLIMQILVDKKI